MMAASWQRPRYSTKPSLHDRVVSAPRMPRACDRVVESFGMCGCMQFTDVRLFHELHHAGSFSHNLDHAHGFTQLVQAPPDYCVSGAGIDASATTSVNDCYITADDVSERHVSLALGSVLSLKMLHGYRTGRSSTPTSNPATPPSDPWYIGFDLVPQSWRSA